MLMNDEGHTYRTHHTATSPKCWQLPMKLSTINHRFQLTFTCLYQAVKGLLYIVMSINEFPCITCVRQSNTKRPNNKCVIISQFIQWFERFGNKGIVVTLKSLPHWLNWDTWYGFFFSQPYRPSNDAMRIHLLHVQCSVLNTEPNGE